MKMQEMKNENEFERFNRNLGVGKTKYIDLGDTFREAFHLTILVFSDWWNLNWSRIQNKDPIVCLRKSDGSPLQGT